MQSLRQFFIQRLSFFVCFSVLFTLGFASFGFADAASSSFQFSQGHVELLPASQGRLLLHFTMKEDWHIYWRNSGDSGAPPKWDWAVQGATLTQVHWPLPERIPVSGLINLGYAKETVFVFDFKSTATQPRTVAEVKLEFLICKVECVPYIVNLRQQIDFAPKTLPDSEKLLSRFVYPTSNAEMNWAIRSTKEGEVLTRLELPSALSSGLKSLELFPVDGESFKAQAPVVELVGSNYDLRLLRQDNASADPVGAKFLLVLENQAGTKTAYEISLKNTEASFALILLWALLGGIILNIMPCVFPVLSIKILSFIGPEKNYQQLRRSGWLYTAGVLVSFLAMGAVLLVLRAGGEQIGWGFHLQSPAVAAGIAVLFFWLGFNFLGSFEIGQSFAAVGNTKSSSKSWAAFLTGALATIVATPCTAPFMGAALGASLAMPAINTLLVFSGLGLGMALPFLILSYFPKALSILPKPGGWMVKLKEFLAFPLFATTIWLVWVLSNQLSANALIFILILFLLIGFWIWLARNLTNEVWRQRLLVLGFILSLAMLTLLPKEPVESGVGKAASSWHKYSTAAVKADLQSKQTVFIDFTASWCITCQVNKKLVLNTADIQLLFAHQKVKLYQADWTNKDSEITEALKSYGRNSLPLYVYYDGASDKAHILPEILTKKMILDLFNKEE